MLHKLLCPILGQPAYVHGELVRTLTEKNRRLLAAGRPTQRCLRPGCLRESSQSTVLLAITGSGIGGRPVSGSGGRRNLNSGNAIIMSNQRLEESARKRQASQEHFSCPCCGYDLRQISIQTCPECGAPLDVVVASPWSIRDVATYLMLIFVWSALICTGSAMGHYRRGLDQIRLRNMYEERRARVQESLTELRGVMQDSPMSPAPSVDVAPLSQTDRVSLLDFPPVDLAILVWFALLGFVSASALLAVVYYRRHHAPAKLRVFFLRLSVLIFGLYWATAIFLESLS